MQTDLEFRDHGSIWTLYAQTDPGDKWLSENVSEEGFHAYADRIVESRYVPDIIGGALADGISVSVDGREVVGIEPFGACWNLGERFALRREGGA